MEMRPGTCRPATRWWILCRVIDNFGDAGVCWRLARQLATEHHAEVTLFIDRPERLAGLAGGDGALTAGGPTAGSVSVAPWPDSPVDPHIAPPQILLSAFGCEPPAWIRALLAGGPRQPLWINLEYLSAESWVDGCHGLASIKPDGAVEHFFYPGFTPATGGLLRERDAVADAVSGNHGTDALRSARLTQLCSQEPLAGERVLTLFCYPGPAVDALLAALADGERPTLLLVPAGVAPGQIEAFAGRPLQAGDPAVERGRLRIARIPFLSQSGYDDLLRLADLNFVRGEDSWVRAHWARRPFIWQPYRQEQGSHHDKLEAFLDRLTATAALIDPEACVALATMMRAWSGYGGGEAGSADPGVGPAWQALARHELQLGALFRPWIDSLLGQADLALQLAAFAERKLQQAIMPGSPHQ